MPITQGYSIYQSEYLIEHLNVARDFLCYGNMNGRKLNSCNMCINFSFEKITSFC